MAFHLIKLFVFEAIFQIIRVTLYKLIFLLFKILHEFNLKIIQIVNKI
jgi:hypothetical protein